MVPPFAPPTGRSRCPRCMSCRLRLLHATASVLLRIAVAGARREQRSQGSHGLRAFCVPDQQKVAAGGGVPRHTKMWIARGIHLFLYTRSSLILFLQMNHAFYLLFQYSSRCSSRNCWSFHRCAGVVHVMVGKTYSHRHAYECSSEYVASIINLSLCVMPGYVIG